MCLTSAPPEHCLKQTHTPYIAVTLLGLEIQLGKKADVDRNSQENNQRYNNYVQGSVCGKRG